MALVINSDNAAHNAQRSLERSQAWHTASAGRVPPTPRVARHQADDQQAGPTQGPRLQVRGINVAAQDTNEAIVLAQTAEGALGWVGGALDQMRDLALQARSATDDPEERDALDKAFGKLAGEVHHVLGSAAVDDRRILGPEAGPRTFRVGPGSDGSGTVTVVTKDLSGDPSIKAVAGKADDVDGTRPRIDGSADDKDVDGVIDAIDSAKDKVDEEKANIGSLKERFGSVVLSLQIAAEIQSAARGKVLDPEAAAHTAAASRAQILQHPDAAMLAQANPVSSAVLELLEHHH